MKSITLLTAKDFSKIKDSIKFVDEPISGEGTYIKRATSPSKWAHVAIKIVPTEQRYFKTLFVENAEDFPEHYKTEISEVVDTFALIYSFWFEKIPNFRVEVHDATYWPGETTCNNFFLATINAIVNAFDPKLHMPDLNQIRVCKSKFVK